MPSAAPGPAVTASRVAESASASVRPASDVTGRWRNVVSHLLESKPALGAVMQHGAATEVSDERIVLVFPTGSFFGQQAATNESKDALLDAAEAVLGKRPTLEVQFSTNAAAAGPTVAQLAAQQNAQSREAQKREALNHQSVVDALEVFPESAGRVEVNVDGD